MKDYQDKLLGWAERLQSHLKWDELVLEGLQNAEKEGALSPQLWQDYILSIKEHKDKAKKELDKLVLDIEESRYFHYLERRIDQLEIKLGQGRWKEQTI